MACTCCFSPVMREDSSDAWVTHAPLQRMGRMLSSWAEGLSRRAGKTREKGNGYSALSVFPVTSRSLRNQN